MSKQAKASVSNDCEAASASLSNNQKHLVAPEQYELSCDLSDDEKIDIVAQRVLQKYLPAFKELAK